MNNESLMERLDRHFTAMRIIRESEDSGMKLESMIRSLISDEQEAISNYQKAAAKLERKASEQSNDLLYNISKVFVDIANEEKVHVGELNKCLKMMGVSGKEEQEGEEEAEEMF